MEQTEGVLLTLSNAQRQVGPYAHAKELIEGLKGVHNSDDSTRRNVELHQEVGSFMVESIPSRPWGLTPHDFLNVESNMKTR